MVDFLANSSQEQIVDAVNELLERESPVERVALQADREISATALWRELANIGLFGLSAPEDAGGAGLTIVEDALVARLAGRHLVSPSALAAVIAVQYLLQLGMPWHTDIINGNRRVSFAVPTSKFGHDKTREVFLIDARGSDLLLYVNCGQLALLAMESMLDPEAVNGLDETLNLRKARLPAENPTTFKPSVQAELSRWLSVMCSAYLVGNAEASRDLAVAHAISRVQFGQPIGAFQAIKHVCADMAVRCEAAYCQTLFAALSLLEQRSDAPFQTAAAGMIAADAALENAAHSVQVHGGMGFSEECNAHRYLKRAHVISLIAESAVRHADDVIKYSPGVSE